MNRTVLRRVERLEAAQPQYAAKWHRIIYDEDEDPEPLRAAMVASGEAEENDNFMLIKLVTPKRTWE